MTPPPLKTRLIGNHLVCAVITLTTLAVCYATWQNSANWPAALLMLLLTKASLSANEAMVKYRGWKRAWDGMAEPAPARGPMKLPGRKLALPAIIVVLFAYCYAHAGDPAYAFALGWLVVGSAIFGGALLVRRLRGARARRPAAMPVVAVCVRRPVMPVPDMATAYRLLPEHCQRLLAGQHRP